MFFRTDPNQPGTLRFQLFGFPIAIHWSFWVIPILFGAGGGGDPVEQTRSLLILVIVFFISILGHELGHALAYRRYGGRPSIFIYAMGGMAAVHGYYTRKQKIVITVAGPFFGFVMAGVCYGILFLGQDLQSGAGVYLRYFLILMIYLNTFWSFLNLLPIIPLDGGQLLGHIMNDKKPVLRGKIGAFTAFVAGIILFQLGYIFGMILFGFLAYQNLQAAERAKRGYW
ncbi:MAG: site-2 protease family protein [Verrucomicrobiota bacterium]|nr:site-2 protease family protein [Verrucomicrobiota bacterium]